MASSSTWTWEQNKLFENALVIYNEDTPDRWDKIAQACGKTVEEVKRHYEDLVEDIRAIEAGLVPIPNYELADEGEKSKAEDSKAPSKSNPKQ